jgi:membrane-bound serine protease (ClpP class)
LGIVFLILAFASMQTLATNYAGLALIVLGISFFIAEALTPGLGILAFGGIICTGIGSLLLFDGSVPGMGISLSLIITFTLTTAAITIFLVTLVIRSHNKKVVSGTEGMIDEEGEVYAQILAGKEGKVSVHGEIWNAIANENLAKGEKIIVTHVNGLCLTVRKLK